MKSVLYFLTCFPPVSYLNILYICHDIKASNINYHLKLESYATLCYFNCINYKKGALKMILKDDLLRIGFDTYIENTEDELLENDKKYLNDKKESERIMNRLLEILEEKEHKKMLIDFEEKIYGNGVIEKEYAYRMGVLDGFDLAESINSTKKTMFERGLKYIY
nr:MAG TPA: hypothetical protein [Bacteriophage sp.]